MSFTETTYRSADVPGLFEHHLDPALFTSDRLDDLCREADRRGTLIARREPNSANVYRFDIHMQGDKETVFFDL